MKLADLSLIERATHLYLDTSETNRANPSSIHMVGYNLILLSKMKVAHKLDTCQSIDQKYHSLIVNKL
jgi:hypothetical protein